MRLGCAQRLAAAVMLVMGLRAWGQEAGELFPNVKSYDDDVAAPVSKPEKALEMPPVRERAKPAEPAAVHAAKDSVKAAANPPVR